MICEKCEKYLNKSDVIKFDEFGKLEEAHKYCYSCFVEIITTQFNSLGNNCNKCGAPLELKTVDLDVDVIEEKVLWYWCKRAIEAKDFEKYENHDSIGEYITQPEADL